jgi:hypothetical protein
MPPKALRIKPLSPSYWDKLAPPVDQELWKRYMNEDDSDSDILDSEEEESMAGPPIASKPANSEAPEAKTKSKNDLVSHLKLYPLNGRVSCLSYTHEADFARRSREFWTIPSTT